MFVPVYNPSLTLSPLGHIRLFLFSSLVVVSLLNLELECHRMSRSIRTLISGDSDGSGASYEQISDNETLLFDQDETESSAYNSNQIDESRPQVKTKASLRRNKSTKGDQEGGSSDGDDEIDFDDDHDDDNDDEDDDEDGPFKYGPSPTNPFADPNTCDPTYNDTPHLDRYGNTYTQVDFNAAKYTNKIKLKGNRLVYFTSAFVSLFVSLFGYEQGVCSGILTYSTFRAYYYDPTPTEIGVVISILEIGAMVSSLLVSKISEVYGRKKTILLGTLIFIVGGFIQSFSPNLIVFGLGRVLSGIGVGILSTIVPSYQCEISPSEERGKLVCGEFTGNICGYCLSVWVDYFCYFLQPSSPDDFGRSFKSNISWRLPLFLQVVIAVILFIGGLFIVESPRWLLDVDRDDEGFKVLALLYADAPSIMNEESSLGTKSKPVEEFFMIKNSILYERVTIPKQERTYKFMFKNYLTRILIGCSSLAFAQFNGINIISYYAPLVFEEAGFNDSNALLMTGINGLVYLASTIPPWFLVDKWGRKPILISGGLSMAVCLTLIATVMWLDRSYTPSLVALLVIIYNASFGYSWGPIGFLIPPEVYPLSIRSKGVSLSTASNWLANYIVGQLTPILQNSIGWVMYLFPAISCILSIIVVWIFYPETKGLN